MGILTSLRLNPLHAARKQTLRVSHLETLLRKYGSVPPTPSLIRALQRWEDHGSEVSLESMQVLRVTSPEILQEIMKSKAARYLAEPLRSNCRCHETGNKRKSNPVVNRVRVFRGD